MSFMRRHVLLPARNSHSFARVGVCPDVISPGSESADVSPFVRLASRYDRVLVWADTGEKVARMLAQLAHPNAAGMASEEIGGTDANDVLQDDPALLADLIASGLPPEAHTFARVGVREAPAITPPESGPLARVGSAGGEGNPVPNAAAKSCLVMGSDPAPGISRAHACGCAGGEAKERKDRDDGRNPPVTEVEPTAEEWREIADAGLDIEGRDEPPRHVPTDPEAAVTLTR